MTPQDAASALDAIHILDVRSDEEVLVASLPHDVIHIPLDRLPAEWQSLPTDKPIVVMCHHGVRSQRAANFLAAQGLDATSMTGGIEAWSLAVDGSVPRY